MRRWLISPILACSALPHSGHGYVGPAEVLLIAASGDGVPDQEAEGGTKDK